MKQKKQQENHPKGIGVYLSSNSISDDGAQYIGDKLKNVDSLVYLDFALNYIADWGMEKLIITLKPLLLHPSFEGLIITGNYGANTTNIQRILDQLEEKEILEKKIIYNKGAAVNLPVKYFF